jgi:hypothetical protein
MAKVHILNPMVYGKIKLLAPIINPDTQDVLHKAGDVLSWDDFVHMLSLGIEKIDIEVAEEGVTV